MPVATDVELTTRQVARIAAIRGAGPSEQVRRIARKIGIPIEVGGSGYPITWAVDEAIRVAVARALVGNNPRQARYEQYEDAARAVSGLHEIGADPTWLVVVAGEYGVWSADQADELAAVLIVSDEPASVLCLRPIFDRLEAVA